MDRKASYSLGVLLTRRPGRPRLLREMNDRAALELLLEGPATRAQVVAATGLSKPTAAQLLARLEAAGLVRMTGTSAGSRGPSAQLYSINSAAGYAIGVDVAPRRVVAAMADITGRTMAEASARADMRRSSDPVQDVVQLIRQVARSARVPVQAVGHVAIASPGVHDSEKDLIKHAEHMPAWARPGVLGSLRRHLRVPVTIGNDVNVAAVAERRLGAARDVNSFALLWVSSGLGLAIDLGGSVHRGATGGAGEVGYMPLPGFAAPRRAGRAAEFQELVSGAAVVALARDHGIRARTADTAVRRAAEDAAGRDMLLELADRLATGVAMIVSVLDPELVVLGGDTMVAGGEQLTGLIARRLRTLTPLRPRLALTAVSGNAVLVGALRVGVEAVQDEIFASTHRVLAAEGAQ